MYLKIRRKKNHIHIPDTYIITLKKLETRFIRDKKKINERQLIALQPTSIVLNNK